MKRWLLAAACGVVALGLLLYPLVGELLSEKYHSDVETTYTAAIADTDDAELAAQRQAAEQYNAMLSGAAITEGGASAPPSAYYAPYQAERNTDYERNSAEAADD